jgi:Rrf2 family iron-sulfur cluster assembly transcriptional regulator
MRLTSKGRYAVRAMLDLSFHSDGTPVRLQEISTRQRISLHYLEQLFRKLRNGQTVNSVRGPGGGYVLARSMDEISIKDVLDCVGENTNPAKDILGSESETANTVQYQLSKNYFQNLGVIMKEYLSTTSLGDLMRKGRDIKLDQPEESNFENISKAHELSEDDVIREEGRTSIGEINQ